VTRILLVEDEESYREPLAYLLGREGYDVSTAATGTDALVRFDDEGADLVLLDLMLPGLPGTEVCRRLRATSEVPIIMLTAKDGEIDKVVGLELGADDYVTKPYSSRELTARIRAILRRAAFLEHAEDVKALAFGPIQVDTERRAVLVEGQAVELTRKEFELLEYFLRNPRRVLSRERILQQVWGLEYLGESRTIDAHVRRVRAKLGEAAELIETVVGVGYRLGSVQG
jgi:two-component system response regulator RegX3